MITKENLLTLQAMVWHLNRKDLYEDFVAFCEQMDKTLYFFEEPSQESGILNILLVSQNVIIFIRFFLHMLDVNCQPWVIYLIEFTIL